ncbi:MAG: hypothetical protein V5A46_05175 [Haloferacaceae archaeon]
MDDHEDEPDPDARVTAPMQEFTSTQVGIGFLVLVVGLVIAFGIPLAVF